MTSSPSHMWKPPSRSSSINSLASTYSQVPATYSTIFFVCSIIYKMYNSLPFNFLKTNTFSTSLDPADGSVCLIFKFFHLLSVSLTNFLAGP